MQTDEERAREIAEELGAYEGERRFWQQRLMTWAEAIRANQREKDAGIAEGAISAAQAQAGSITFCSGFTCHDIAAAIRKGGET